MGKSIDLTGKTFGRLTVLAFAGNGSSRKRLWTCKCECGSAATVRAGDLRSGATRSCGCLQSENRIKHGNAKRGQISLTFSSWRAMKQRCLNVNQPCYAHYGERGVMVCERWHGKNGFGNFLVDMGARPGPEYSLGRFADSGNYEPGNCAWQTRAEQTIEHSKKLALAA